MNNFLDSHCRMRVSVPVGLPELIGDIASQVLLNKPTALVPFIADYLESKLKARNVSKNVSNYINDVFSDVRAKLLKSYEKRGISREVAEEAATKIQAVYKGHKVRQVLYEMAKKRISIATDVEVQQQHKPRSQQRSFHRHEDTQSIKYLKTSETSVAESCMYHLSSKLHLPIEANDQTSLLMKYSSLESVKSEYIPPVKATVLTDLQVAINDSRRNDP